MVKHERMFYIIAAIVFLITTGLLVLIGFVAFGSLKLSTGHILLLVLAFLFMMFMSFCCGCILDTYIDDWRRIRHERKWSK